MRTLSVLLLLFWLRPVAAADNMRCIENPKRQKACPHLLYRVAELPGMAAAVVCICVTDFALLLQQPANETEQIKQNMARRQFEVVHGDKLETVLAILNRKI
ncbi:hypothetical protein [Rheinheimera maricola]|uniref:Uncharacterized protein n=1 Tax=Rheinheimera maricola TaxID=2793282 RepID=A0ABS7XAM5_9GAMM|nr:hypothetical protein [Rheinheimera maricola]MBZ9612609.1 hypothetical protein [Rheinheimera maricola]